MKRLICSGLLTGILMMVPILGMAQDYPSTTGGEPSAVSQTPEAAEAAEPTTNLEVNVEPAQLPAPKVDVQVNPAPVVAPTHTSTTTTTREIIERQPAAATGTTDNTSTLLIFGGVALLVVILVVMAMSMGKTEAKTTP
ncbi:MAG: hypothetical protein AB7J86_18230 [Vulcanimicrobiota bacterium]